MRKLLITLTVVIALCLTTNSVWASPVGGDKDTATCAISVTVDSIAEWAENFAALEPNNITSQSDTQEAYCAATLYTNGNLEIGADTSATAQLSDGNDVLVTKYKIAFDYDGAGSNTYGTAGAQGATYQAHSSFLNTTKATVTHYTNDGNIEVTLWVEASNDAGDLADASAYYSATQTLTITWP